MPSTTADPVSKPAAERPGWLSWSIAVLFGLFFAYDVFEAVGNLVGIVGTANGLAVPVLPLGWVVLIGGLLLPIVAFAIACWTGRDRSLGEQAVRYLVALCVVAPISLSVLAMFGAQQLIDLSV
ncbi:bacitracin resistance protein [uncultured Plantibacter sp.]|uniref:bacitracin resistance protein n=1 Tax=uncultured Plantibacter sp. TaxID=293337 RepID=UPI0028D4379E|nr:bacitracin resistance protein [uncultured Plantibacter sp.]